MDKRLSNKLGILERGDDIVTSEELSIKIRIDACIQKLIDTTNG